MVAHAAAGHERADDFVDEAVAATLGIAGDELDKVTPDSLIATGYMRLGLYDDEAPDKTLALYDDLDQHEDRRQPFDQIRDRLDARAGL